MSKGIIMEIRRDVLIMMTPDGQFVNGKKKPNQQYVIGEEIAFFPEMKESRVKVKRNWKTAASILSAAVLMLTLFSASLLQSNKAYAYVSVDINPSIELTLNRDQQVLEITPYNEDGEILIQKLEHWEKDKVSEVAEEIMRMSAKLGYLKNDQNVWITSTFTNLAATETHSALLKDLNKFVKLYNDLHSAKIIMNETTEDLRDEAVKKGVTAGTLLKENEVIANPAEDKEEKPSKDTSEEKKATVPAASNDDGNPHPSKHGEKKQKAPTSLEQDNKAGNNEKRNNGMKDRSRGENKDSEKFKGNNGSHQEENQSDNRSHPEKNEKDDRRNKSNGHEGRSNHHDNKPNNQQKNGNEGKGEKEKNH
jgi:hypothetical protein